MRPFKKPILLLVGLFSLTAVTGGRVITFVSLSSGDADSIEVSKTVSEEVVQKEELPSDCSVIEDVMNIDSYPTATIEATGYTAGEESTGKTEAHPAYGITYSGVEVKRDLYSTIAADLDIYPLGTILYIPGYGFGVVADKGSAIVGNKIDLYYHTVDEVYAEWGKQELDAYIIKIGNGTVTEADFEALNEREDLQVFREQLF